MEYEKIHIKNRDNKPLRTKGIADYPQPKSEDLPRLHFASAIVGARGSGKSFSVAKLISIYESEGLYFHGKKIPIRTILVSPTADTNLQYLELKSLSREDIHEEYSDDLLLSIIADVKNEHKLAKEYQERLAVYERFLSIKDINDISEKDTFLLEQWNYEEPEPEGNYESPPAVFLIMDDLQGSGAYSNSGNSKVMNLAIKGRHVGMSLFFLVQTIKQLPKAIRANATLFALYRYNSDSIIKDMYNEVSSILTPELFAKIYEDTTSEKYQFMTIDQTHPNLMIKQNWNILIKINEIKKIEKEILKNKSHKEPKNRKVLKDIKL